MEFTIGTYIAIAAALFFYLRLIILQRQKLKQKPQAQGKKNGKARGTTGSKGSAGYQPALRSSLVIANRFFVIGGVVLIVLGAAVSLITGLDSAVRSAWWLPVTVGIVLMSLGIR